MNVIKRHLKISSMKDKSSRFENFVLNYQNQSNSQSEFIHINKCIQPSIVDN